MNANLLPLLPDSLINTPHLPGVFGLFDIQSFLHLTVGKRTDVEAIFKETEIDLKDHDPKKYGIPWLRVAQISGRVIGHNGRHRAAMCIRQGHTMYPLVIILQELSLKTKRYKTIKGEMPEKLIGQFIPSLTIQVKDVFHPMIWLDG